MIPNHARFIEAIHAKKKVWVRYFSVPDGGPVDRVCAPLDYGPADGIHNGLNRYWFWDYAKSTTLVLAAQPIAELQVLGETFDPSGLPGPPAMPGPWQTPRDWAAPTAAGAAPSSSASANVARDPADGTPKNDAKKG
jgi:hypothetical protein